MGFICMGIKKKLFHVNRFAVSLALKQRLRPTRKWHCLHYRNYKGYGYNFRRNDFWVRLGGQALVVIGRWCSRQPGTNHRLNLSSQKIPEIVAPKACTHSPYSFGSGKYSRFCMRLGWCCIELNYGIVLGDENKGFGDHKGRRQLHRCRTSKKHSNEV